MRMTSAMTSVNASDVYEGYPIKESVRLGVLIVGWLACVGGVLGNILIITTLFSQPALRSLHNLYIGNLAVADLVISVYVTPFWLVDLSSGHHPVLNENHCRWNALINAWAFSTSIFNLVIISVNRYFSVCHHLLFLRLCARQNTLMLCVCTWVLGLSASLPGLLYLGQHDSYDPMSRMCVFSKHRRGGYNAWFTFTVLSLPSVIVGLCNLAIFRYWKNSRRRLQKWRLQPATASQHGPSSCALQSSVLNLTEKGSDPRPDAEKSHQSVTKTEPKGNDSNVHKVGDDEMTNDICAHSNVALLGHSTRREAAPTEELIKSEEDRDSASAKPANQRQEETIHETSARNCSDPDSSSHLHLLSNTVQDSAKLFISSASSSQNPNNPLCKTVNVDLANEERSTSERRKRCHHQRLSPSDLSLIRSLLTVSICCVVLYSPLALVSILNAYSEGVSIEVVICSMACSIFNHTVNWIVYGLMNRAFREGYVKQFSFCCGRLGLESG